MLKKARSQIHVNSLTTQVALIAACLIVSQLPLSIEGQNSPPTPSGQSFRTTLSESLFGSTLNRSRTSPSVLNVWSSYGPPLQYAEVVDSLAVDPSNVLYCGTE